MTALIGPSGRGKTTASRTLAGSGWTYLSDETCAIDPATLSVLPYPKPLSVIEHPGAPKAQWAASGIGLNTWRRGKGAEPRLSRLVILDRVDEAPSGQEDGLYPMPLLRGVQILAEQSSGLAQTPHALRGLAELAERVGGIWRVQYRDASQLPGLLAGAGDRDHQEWEYVEAMGATGEAAIAPADDERPAASIVSRNPATSGLLTEEGILLMHADRTVLYTPVGADLWLEAGGGITREGLRQRLEDIYGPAPEGAFEAALAAAVDDGGVLESVRGPRDGTEDTPPWDEAHPASGAEEAAS